LKVQRRLEKTDKKVGGGASPGGRQGFGINVEEKKKTNILDILK